MSNRRYLYKYVVRDEDTGVLFAEFESDAVPPPVGAMIDLAEFVESLEKNPVFEILALRYQPFRLDDQSAFSDQMLVDLVVERRPLRWKR